MDYKKHIAEKLASCGIDKEEIEAAIAVPPDNKMGDYALPCFKFAKVMRKSPVAIAEELKNMFATDDAISEVEAVNGYLNFRVNRTALVKETLEKIAEQGAAFGSSDIGNGKTICIDYSSVNIAKPFHIGHLSTTVIGGALYRIFKFLGYNTVGINHLGDYGTQFGKLIYAYKHWGSEEAVKEGGVKELTRLYVRYHKESENDPSMDDEARSYFKLIENGDEECVKLFNLFKEITLKEVEKIYDELDIKFDSYAGESFYNDKMQPVIDELTEKGLLVESEGAKIVDLEKYGMPPCIILRSDGASLYATRDLAAACYRKEHYDFDKCLYVVAYQQNLHFKQIFKVLELMGKPWAKDLVHVAYGMVSLLDDNGNQVAMSTRNGTVVLLEDVLKKCHEKCLEIIEQKNPDLEDKENVARQVGTGAVIFGALSNSKIKDIAFSYSKILNFDGETGPYVQYTAARIKSVLRKGGAIGKYEIKNVNEDEYQLIALLSTFPDVVKAAAERLEPFFVTRYAIDVASAFNKFYFDCKIIGDDVNETNFRLAISSATLTVLSSALTLLGIKVPERM
ncbi:MAG: arginine--tRNA ligase [Clostridia bacterium]|nr:arginine--tRNA ligase [Clostridia bacterium]MDY2900636.1 arginine--tRNA ligase [Christensenellaceae bacterium]